jgi:hypothetical protein
MTTHAAQGEPEAEYEMLDDQIAPEDIEAMQLSLERIKAHYANGELRR